MMTDGHVEGSDRRRIEAFLEAYRHSPYAGDRGREPVALIPSPIDEEMVREHEDLIGAPLPPLFRAYLRAACLPVGDLDVGQLPIVVPDRPFEWVERWSIEKMEQRFYRRNERLVPFTHGPADCSDLCFDIHRPDPGGDYPIVKVWHGRIDGAAGEWSDADCDRARVFGGFAEYLDYLQEWLVYRSIEPESPFDSWLRSRGRTGPPKSYGQPG